MKKALLKKNKLLLFSLIIFLGCSELSVHDKFSRYIDFNWGISTFYYYNNRKDLELDLLRDERIDALSFKHHKYLLFRKIKSNGNTKKYNWFTSEYNIFKKKDTLKFSISNSEDERFNATYNMYLDTVDDSGMYHHLILTLDSENVYIVAEKFKSKPSDYYKN